jgi:aspartyl-tRNA(Asn)/glutamyl-tRNA(Gln) amidotransferase subunit B
MKYAQVSGVDLYHGNMRFDVNVSIAAEGADELGTRSEVKNLNSFKSVERAAKYEIERQTKLLDRGEAIVQETRGWDDAKQKTVPQRGKENAHDYRYFPEPDVPPVTISRNQVDSVRKKMPIMPAQLRSEFAEHDVSAEHIVVLINNRSLALLAHEVLQVQPAAAKAVASWLATDVMAMVNDSDDFDWAKLKLDAPRLIELMQMVADDKLSSNGATRVVQAMMTSTDSPADIAERESLLQISDDAAIEKIVYDVIASNESAAQDVRDGEMKAIGFLVGQVMQQSKGQANPQTAKRMLVDKLK